MKKTILCLLVALLSTGGLTACDNNSSGLKTIFPDGNDGSGGNEGNDGNEGNGEDPDPGQPVKSCEGKEYANALNALKTRDAAKASEQELIAYSQCVLEVQKYSQPQRQALATIYQGLGETFSWDPGKEAHAFKTTRFPHTFSILGVNETTSSKDEYVKIKNESSLAVAREFDGHRYIALAANPIFVGANASTSHWMKNMVIWLTGGENRNTASYRLLGKENNKLNVIIAQMKRSEGHNGNYDALKTWLDQTYPDAYTLNEADSCDNEQLKACLSSQPVDLLIIGDGDKGSQGYAGIKDGIDYAEQSKIPLLSMTANAGVNTLIAGVYNHFFTMDGASFTDIIKNYFSGFYANNSVIADLLQPTQDERYQTTLLDKLRTQTFDPRVFEPSGDEACYTSVIKCELPAFTSAFRGGANVYRSALMQLDKQHVDVLANYKTLPLLAAGVLLADKYRQQLDYPISMDNESSQFQKGMFADWVVSYSRPDNIAQPDLGEYAVSEKEVVKGHLASVEQEATVTEQRQFSIPYPKQWTTSGWYAPAGKPITISSSKDSAEVVVQLGFGFTDVYYTVSNRKLVAPSEVSHKDVTRLTLAPGETRTFSTPYGAPVYIRFVDNNLTTAKINASGVMHYPAVLDLSDDAQIDEFDRRISDTTMPYVDLRTNGVEYHALKFRFTDGIKGNGQGGVENTRQMLERMRNFYKWNYTLAGFKIQGTPLNNSLPGDVFKVCSGLFGGSDCTDEVLHTRSTIVHAVFDQRSRCYGGGGCSGNPFDTSWEINPYGWGDSHEVGHNLQIIQLHGHYVEEADKENWSKYGKRTTDNSNNIFPYHVLWQSTYGLGQTEPVRDGHYDPKDVYSIVMSELRGLKDSSGNPAIYDRQCRRYAYAGSQVNRYTVPWHSDANVPDNIFFFRLEFYLQMLLQADKQEMRTGDKLENGFGIYTLMYQHARIFNKYAATEDEWNANRDKLGFSLFAHSGDATYGDKNVRDIPGNDFMLVSLSWITNMDWRPYFDMFGLHYTTLASQQVAQNGSARPIKQEIFTHNTDSLRLPNADISLDPEFVPIDMTNKDATFPNFEWNCNGG